MTKSVVLTLLLAMTPVLAAEKYVDPVPHDIITQPYRVCQDLEELTSRINNLYRKPFDKTFDKTGAAQPETIFFKDVTSGHEVMSLTRELCMDISHSDLGRPVWTVDGRKIMFMGNRGLIDKDGKLKVSAWGGKNFVMNADYSDQRAMVVEMVDESGNVTGKADGMPGKYNIMDPIDASLAYYADKDKLYRVRLTDDPAKPSRAEQIATFATKQNKIIQAISRDRKLLIQDLNADPDRKTKELPYMPEIHLVNLNKKPGEEGFYYHHPFDYGLPEVKGLDGKILHDAKNNYQFHSLMFAGNSNTIGWNYGPMTSVGEYIGYSLDVTNGLDGTPKHGEITKDGGGNKFKQYESHGRMVGPSKMGLYFSGPATLEGGKKIGEWGLWVRDYEAGTPPTFITPAPGGHVAGGESFNPDYFAAHIQASTPEWRKRIKASDSIFMGDVREPQKSKILCYTYSDVRGGTKKDRATGKLIWSGMDNNDFRPYSSVPRPLLSRDGTKVWFHSCMLMPTEDWVGIYVAVLRRPDAPVELSLAEGSGVKLTWKPAPLAVETKGFHVYRSEGDGEAVDLSPDTVLARVDGKIQPSYEFVDSSAKAGKTYTYFVTAEEWSTLESDTTSNALRVSVNANGATAQPSATITKFDKTAPAAVKQFEVKCENEPGQYRLTWQPSDAVDVRYYNIYYSASGQPEVTQKRLVASPLKSMSSYLDWSAPVEGSAHYAITVVDRQGNESAPTYVQVR